jgi:CheY-like chemotaxis protein
MKRLLRAEGHAVEHAGDVFTALQLVAQKTFDLLLSDLGLPDGTGWDIMRVCRQRGLDMPAVALSGYSQERDIQESLDAGFNAHLVKPLDIRKLMTVLHNIR